jgi:hypothetical protein
LKGMAWYLLSSWMPSSSLGIPFSTSAFLQLQESLLLFLLQSSTANSSFQYFLFILSSKMSECTMAHAQSPNFSPFTPRWVICHNLVKKGVISSQPISFSHKPLIIFICGFSILSSLHDFA